MTKIVEAIRNISILVGATGFYMLAIAFSLFTIISLAGWIKQTSPRLAEILGYIGMIILIIIIVSLRIIQLDRLTNPPRRKYPRKRELVSEKIKPKHKLVTINPLLFEELNPLLEASLDEGYSFIQKLWDEHQNGDFNHPSARLIGVYQNEQLVGIGGIHPDPYLNQPQIGRIRHVYILPEFRRLGLGADLIRTLIENSPFEFITLRTPTEHGNAFYRALGFSTEPRFEHATHWLAV